MATKPHTHVPLSALAALFLALAIGCAPLAAVALSTDTEALR